MKLRKSIVRGGLITAAVLGAALAAVPAFAATAGTVVISDPVTAAVLTSGSSTANLELKPTGQGFCTGSSNSGYFITGYITSADPATLTFDALGPHSSVAGSTSYPMFDVSQTQYIDRPTAPPAAGQTQGQVLPTGALTLSLFDTTSLPVGTYHIGLACHNGAPIDNYWDQTIVVTASTGGAFDWSAPSAPNVPEVPMAIVLPLSALAVLGAAGAFEMRRRRQDQAALV